MAYGVHSAYIYVDAQYIRKELQAAGLNDEFNPSPLWQHVQATSADNQPIRAQRMFFYDAVDETASPTDQQKLQEYLSKVEALTYVSVATGHVRPGKRNRQQKGVDVQIAVDALEAASSGRAEAIILVAGDADFAPLAEAVRRTGAFILVFGFKNSLSVELRRSADVVGLLPDIRGNYPPF
jgi:uncharacterized LabA/DUF88 family protein